MKNLWALALLSIFMAMPAMAEIKLVDGGKFVSGPAIGNPQGYLWEQLVDSVWISAGETAGPQRIFTTPHGVKFNIRVWPVVHGDPSTTDPSITGSVKGPFVSEPTVKYSIFPDFDFDNNGAVGISDYGWFLNNAFSIQQYGLFVQVFGYKIINGVYVQ